MFHIVSLQQLFHALSTLWESEFVQDDSPTMCIFATCLCQQVFRVNATKYIHTLFCCLDDLADHNKSNFFISMTIG